MQTIRPFAIAGSFYPDNPQKLADSIDQFMHHALAMAKHKNENLTPPKALIVPHAGHIYSGAIAASAYIHCLPIRESIRRIVLLGPAHRVYFRGIALSGASAFSTPLGTIPIDSASEHPLRAVPYIIESVEAHEHEHSLEVQLPFLQRLFPQFSVVPLVVGEASAEEVAHVLESLWGGDETLILISSDLSHFLSYAMAKIKDEQTAQAIIDLKESIDPYQACGCMPINGLLHLSKRKPLYPRLLDLRNSGDTAGDKHKVVGYGSFAFYEHTHRS